MTHVLRYLRPAHLILFLGLVVLSLGVALAQPKYRTFSQASLAEKKAKAGKPVAGKVCFTFHNILGDTVDGVVARINAHILSVDDNGGFATITVSEKGKVLTASGKDVLPGDSVTICLTVDKKSPGAKVSNYYWTDGGFQDGPKMSEFLPTSEYRVFIQPNGGNVREYLYKRVVTRPAGIVIGTPRPDSSAIYGWIRYMKADAKYFPHTGEPRCFDFIADGKGNQKPWHGELKNPHVKKHNNEFLGELHALKLAVLANDSGVTEPVDSLATALGDLLYNDGGNPTDPFNGMTVRGIIALADSAITYCSHFDSAGYAGIEGAVARINAAFDGDYVAVSFTPFLLAGTHTLAEAGFLQPNPAVMPSTRPTQRFSVAEEMPESFSLAQNFPNPFNPSTTISFALPQASVVTLRVYNMLGQEVATLLDRAELSEGEQSVVFDAVSLPSGVYFYRLATQPLEGSASFQQVKRMLLMK
jgi:hypothetical protein